MNGKATVHTNFKTGKADQIPNKAGVGRDNKVFDSLLHALQLMDAAETGILDAGVTDDRIAMVEKCAYSSINRERRKILEILVDSDSQLTSGEIGTRPGLGLESDSVNQYLVPLHAVGLIRKKAGNPAKWWIEDEDTKDFVKTVSATVTDSTPTAKPDEVADDGMTDEERAANDALLKNF